MEGWKDKLSEIRKSVPQTPRASVAGDAAKDNSIVVDFP
jgi:hypothetical protein